MANKNSWNTWGEWCPNYVSVRPGSPSSQSGHAVMLFQFGDMPKSRGILRDDPKSPSLVLTGSLTVRPWKSAIPKRKGSSSNHLFLGATVAVSFRELVILKLTPETNIAPENRPLEKEIPIGNHHFWGLWLLVSGRVKLEFSPSFFFLGGCVYRYGRVSTFTDPHPWKNFGSLGCQRVSWGIKWDPKYQLEVGL